MLVFLVSSPPPPFVFCLFLFCVCGCVCVLFCHPLAPYHQFGCLAPHQAWVDSQFMLGSSVLISPVLANGDRSVRAYFPEAEWYNISTGATMDMCPASSANCRRSPDRVATLDAPLEVINVHVRAGAVIPRQGGGQPTTTVARQQPFELLMVLAWTPAQAGDTESAFESMPDGVGGGDKTQQRLAAGELYIDNGVSYDVGTDFMRVAFEARVSKGDSFDITSQVVHDVDDSAIAPASTTVASVDVYGLSCAVLDVKLEAGVLSDGTAAASAAAPSLSFVQHNRRSTLHVDFSSASPGTSGLDLHQPFHVSVVCATDVEISVWVWLAPLLGFIGFVATVVFCWCRKDQKKRRNGEFTELADDRPNEGGGLELSAVPGASAQDVHNQL